MRVTTNTAVRTLVNNLVAPSEAWERGRHVNHKAETFHWNPAGSQARPGEPDPHPEASLALWWGNPPGEA